MVKTQLLILPFTSAWGWGQAVGSLETERLRSLSSLPLDMHGSASLYVSEAVYFSVTVSQTSDVPGDQISCLRLHLSLSLSCPFMSVSCVCVRPLPPTLVHTEQLQEEQGAEQCPCHPTVWSPGLF